LPFLNWRRVAAIAALICTLTACGAPAPDSNANAVDITATVPTATALTTDVAQVATPLPTLPPPTNPIDAAGAQIVARVNGQPILLADFERALVRSTAQGVNYVDEATQRAAILDTLIDQTLIELAAAQQGLTVDAAALDAELASYVTALGSDAAWTEWLTANFYTEAEFRETLHESLLTNRLRDSITANLSGNVPQVRARHILVATEAEARTVLTRLQNGEPFEALAASVSLDVTTQARGGDLGWFIEEELLDPALARLAFTLPDNGIAGPVQTGLGFHIIQTLQHADMPLQPDKLPLLAQLRFENWLTVIASQATIERYI